ncbi:hypothetical protein [Streptomyces sp. NPDC059639]|uniref:hypothetical protein n=1 Tax=Streptomyces sp. NPDC059639 TaxID=3346891 RepID=UPI0036A9448C
MSDFFTGISSWFQDFVTGASDGHGWFSSLTAVIMTGWMVATSREWLRERSERRAKTHVAEIEAIKAELERPDTESAPLPHVPHKDATDVVPLVDQRPYGRDVIELLENLRRRLGDEQLREPIDRARRRALPPMERKWLESVAGTRTDPEAFFALAQALRTQLEEQRRLLESGVGIPNLRGDKSLSKSITAADAPVNDAGGE